MQRYLPKITISLLIGVAFTLWVASFMFKLNAPRSKATGETIALNFNPTSFSGVAVNQDIIVKIMAKPSIDALLRGYETRINFDKTKLAFKSIQYLVGAVSSGLGDTNNQIAAVNSLGQIKVIGESQVATGALLTTATNTEMLSITFTVLNNAPTYVSFGSSSFYSIKADMSLFNGWTFTSNQLSVNGAVIISSTPSIISTPVITATTIPGQPTLTPALTSTPTLTSAQAALTSAQVGNVDLNVKFKVQGIQSKPVGVMYVRVKLLNNSTGAMTNFSTIPLTPDNNGIWSGHYIFNVPTNAKYTLYAKGQSQIQKKICVSNPTETAGGTYKCSTGNITLIEGINNLDMSGILLLSGDLSDQDGTINAYDTSLIRNNLNTNDASIIAKCDINLDGRCDTQDYSLLISTLSVKNDEE